MGRDSENNLGSKFPILSFRLLAKTCMMSLALYFFLHDKVFAQDPQFSQFASAPIYLNPAFTGTTKGQRLVSNYRQQWSNTGKGYTTFAFSYDYNLSEARSGFGFMAMVDKAGVLAMKTTTLGLSYAFRVQLNRKWMLTPAIQFGYGNRSINHEDILLPDQTIFGDQPSPTVDPLIGTMDGISYFDFSSGVLLYSKYLWVGLSAHHMTNPNLSMIDAESKLHMKTSLHTGFKIPLASGMFKSKITPSIAPSFIFKKQGDVTQVDVGLNFHYNPVQVGVWYRGMPQAGYEEQGGGSSRDALIILLGMDYQQLQFGYSYDITVSSLGTKPGGAHELSLTYYIQNMRPKKHKYRTKEIPCPVFLVNK